MDLQTFQAALHEGVEKERGLQWAEAADLYAELARASSDSAMRALALLRHRITAATMGDASVPSPFLTSPAPTGLAIPSPESPASATIRDVSCSTS